MSTEGLLQLYSDEEIEELLNILGLESVEELTIDVLVEFLESEHQQVETLAEDALHEYISILREDEYKEILRKLDYDDVINFCSSKMLHICSDRWFWISYAKHRYEFDIEETKDYNLYWLKRVIKIISESAKIPENFKVEKSFFGLERKHALLLKEFVHTVVKLENLKKLNFVFKCIKNYDMAKYLIRKVILKDDINAHYIITIVFTFISDIIHEMDINYGIEEYGFYDLWYVYPANQFVYLILSLREGLLIGNDYYHISELLFEEDVGYMRDKIVSNTDLSIVQYYKLYNHVENFGVELWFYVGRKHELGEWSVEDINRQLRKLRDYFNEISYDGINTWRYFPWGTDPHEEGNFIGIDIFGSFTNEESFVILY